MIYDFSKVVRYIAHYVKITVEKLSAALLRSIYRFKNSKIISLNCKKLKHEYKYRKQN